MWFTIEYSKDNETKRIVSNWQGVIAFMKMNLKSDEYPAISQWITNTFAQGGAWAGLESPDGDSFEIYCPDNLPMTVNAPVVINPLRQMVNPVVSVIL